MSIETIIGRLEEKRNSKVITYITNDFPPGSFWTSVSSDVVPIFRSILKAQWMVDKRTLVLSTNGWSLDAVRPIVSLIREFTKISFEVIIMSKALSAWTLISLWADEIIMPKGTFLSPIDPATNVSFNNGKGEQMRSLAIEDVMWYIKFAKERIGLKKERFLVSVLDRISNECAPTMLWSFDRTHRLIRELSRKLLNLSKWKKDIKKISRKLIEELYSHNHLINSKEAKEEVWLKNVIIPNEDTEEIINELSTYYKNKMYLDENKNELSITISWATAGTALEIIWAHIYTLDMSYKFAFKWTVVTAEWSTIKNFNITSQMREKE